MTGIPPGRQQPPPGLSPGTSARYGAAVSEPEPQPQPGWYPDPAGSADLRWWDGAAWTDDVHPGAAAAQPASGAVAPSAAAPTATAPAPAAIRREEGRRRHPALALALIVGLLVVALVAATALVASLTRPKLNTTALEQQIAQQVADAASVPAVVRCPDRVDLIEGSTFTCAIELEGGTTATAIVTQTDDKGGVSWRLDTGGTGTAP
jgi:hypothetical protein